MIEYILLNEVNDQEEHIKQLITLLKKYQYPYLINIIPYNAHLFSSYTKSSRAEKCKQQLIQAGFKTFIRESRGQDINAACGMLTGLTQIKKLNNP